VLPVESIEVADNQQILRVTARHPNSCYQLVTHFKEVEGQKITLYNVATYPRNTGCSRVIGYEDSVFSITQLRSGQYQIYDGEDNQWIADLIVESDDVEVEGIR
jgi:hypothetical protein